MSIIASTISATSLAPFTWPCPSWCTSHEVQAFTSSSLDAWASAKPESTRPHVDGDGSATAVVHSGAALGTDQAHVRLTRSDLVTADGLLEGRVEVLLEVAFDEVGLEDAESLAESLALAVRTARTA